jgi:hypothetical protein
MSDFAVVITIFMSFSAGAWFFSREYPNTYIALYKTLTIGLLVGIVLLILHDYVVTNTWLALNPMFDVSRGKDALRIRDALYFMTFPVFALGGMLWLLATLVALLPSLIAQYDGQEPQAGKRDENGAVKAEIERPDKGAE